ncbi:MAG: hypothetical protein LBU32_18740 [Clostridiales bacterium]|jgi:hypothetical protein|nr:hypothetical protein [Clostridiales bacterium]
MQKIAKEIACNTITPDALDVLAEISASVPLEFTVGDRKYAETFSLVGYWQSDTAMEARQVWLSREYLDFALPENMLHESDIAGTIAADIRFYGLLKTLSATGKQIRGVMRGQALLLRLIIGMPLGLFSGYACGNVLTPLVLSITSFKDASAGNSTPLIFVFSALFSLASVFISCRKPGLRRGCRP